MNITSIGKWKVLTLAMVFVGVFSVAIFVAQSNGIISIGVAEACCGSDPGPEPDPETPDPEPDPEPRPEPKPKPEKKAPTCDAFSASPKKLDAGGGKVTLSWKTSNANKVSISDGVGDDLKADGSKEVKVEKDQRFVLTATGGGEKVKCAVEIKVAEKKPSPKCDAFSASPKKLPAGGGKVTLSWNTSNADRVSINHGVGDDLKADGSKEVKVHNDQRFVLTVKGQGEEVKCDLEVKVEKPVAKPAPKCDAFSASPKKLPAGGGKVTLSWNTSNADKVWINNGVGDVKADGSKEVKVEKTTTFVLTTASKDLIDKCELEVKVEKATPAPTCDAFTVSPKNLPAGGGKVTLSWNTTNASKVSINQGIGEVKVDGTKEVKVEKTTNFVLTATGNGETVKCSKEVKVEEKNPAPKCDAFSASPKNLPAGGGKVTLSWNTSKADTVSINNGVGEVKADGSKVVNVKKTTTFTLTARDNGLLASGSDTCKVTITVKDAPAVKPVCDLFEATPNRVDRGENFTLRWKTTDATDVRINRGIGDVTRDGTYVTSADEDEVYTLTATRGSESVTCQTSVTVDSSNGGGSSNPRCELDISDDRIDYGDSVRLEWDNGNTDDIRLEDDHGNIIIDTDDGDNYDEDEDSIMVKPTRDTEYTLIAYNGNKKDECEVDVEVDGSGFVSQIRHQLPLWGSIMLSQVPYTGFDAGPMLTLVFYALLALWGLGVAYVLVVKRGSVLGFSLPQSQPAYASVTPAYVPAVMAPEAPQAFYQTPVVTPVTTPEVVRGNVSTLVERAHASHVLLSTDALNFIASQAGTQEAQVAVLDTVIEMAKSTFPSEDGWIVINRDRLMQLFG